VALGVGLAGAIRMALQPAVHIVIDAEGRASLRDGWGRSRPLPDTVHIAAGGRPRVLLENDADRAHVVGLFRAPARGSAEYALPGPGSYTGRCTVHRRAEVTFLVR
jgi:hypothetical protein